MRLDLPPLRQRREDIPLLVEVFIERLNLLRNKQVGGIRQDALALLMNYPFPGNIRELENFIEHAFVLCGDGLIEPGFLPEAVRRTIAPPPSHNSLDDACRATEAQMILTALKRHDFNRLAAARELGMHKSTLFRKIRRLGLTLPNTDGRHRI
jgi:transcriptional regulator with PAS, ATPase and Fis domain